MTQEPNESIIETIQKRMDDPSYVPTGPTYGEWMESKTREAVLAERERCARIAENEAIEFHTDNCGCSGCEMSTRIAAAIRSGK